MAYQQVGDGSGEVDGTAGNDVIDIIGGAANLHAIMAGGGNDLVMLDDAMFNGTIDGGTGTDTLLINVDFTFNSGQLTGFEQFNVEGGHSVDFSSVGLQNNGDAGLFIVVDSHAGDAGTIHGSAFNDLITAGAGNDQLYGGDGNDTIGGGAGNDYISGGTGDDVLMGGAGNDYLVGGTGINILYGGADNDVIISTSAKDYIDGGTGNDVATIDRTSSSVALVMDLTNSSDANNTVIVGSDGTRVVHVESVNFYGGSGNDNFTGTAGDDYLNGGLGNDTLNGGAGNDRINGNTGDDTLLGGAGNDIIRGMGGHDRIDGGTGDDKLQGGFDSDTFVFGGNNFGKDKILYDAGNDADPGAAFVTTNASATTHDTIELSQSVWTDFATIMSKTADSGPNVIITLDANNSITIQGIHKADLSASDFHLV